MLSICDQLCAALVALLAEGVDRNFSESGEKFRKQVALLAEGVDRNDLPHEVLEVVPCRPPRGGRG